MPNPRMMENYTPGVDDDPSSFTSYDAEPFVPPPRQPPVAGESLQGTNPPYDQPPPPAYAQPPPEPYAPMVHVAPVLPQTTNDVEFGSNPAMPLTGQATQPKQEYQGQYPPDGPPSGRGTESGKFKKWMIAAIVGILILVGVVVVVAVVTLGRNDSSGDGPSRVVTLPMPDSQELRRAVDAVLSNNGLEGVEATYGPIGEWDVSSIEDFSGLFDATGRVGAAADFNDDISAWNTSRATNMQNMFQGATNFNQGLSGWDMRQVTTIESMFAGATSFNQDISSWQLDSLASMSSAFEGATSFSQDLCPWGDVLASGVVASAAFYRTSCPEANRATDLSFNPSGPLCFSCGTFAPTVTPTGSPTTAAPTGTKLCFGSFIEIAQAVDIYLQNSSDELVLDPYGPIGNWCVSGVTTFDNLFDADRNPLAEFFNEDISGWQMSNAQSLFAMFEGAREFDQDLSGWVSVDLIVSPKVQNTCADFSLLLFCRWLVGRLKCYRFRGHVQQCHGVQR